MPNTLFARFCSWNQLPVQSWHEYIGNATIADAILDRILSNAHRLEMQGESMRKKEVLLD